ncbi:NAD(P)H-quinone oxidoreductase [Hyphococcus flavus]|uniref:NAD(P)H-quinone oxidoreductase n=1 Tax=Hyphococcus flavus TaxID=1866326 RepID=A0AAE9ZD81_9PROT|nr:NAD(P)H-quinone oxidoreductase [Hyphococcus flavus]WDI31430.1 NAD(P)H-quinone oxidoreductase [Hyphococcus flavus]
MTGEYPQSMQAIEISEPGGPEVLRLVSRSSPVLTPNEVLIRVAAAGVNRPDVLQRMGLYPPPPGASDLPGLEAAGEIAAIGGDVRDWKVGNRVCALLTGGGYAEYAAADAGSCLPVPKGLSFEEAAALPETVFTVWANVFDDAQLKTGETLLVHGGTSGIGVTAIAMANAFGAKVIATAGSNEKRDECLKLGAAKAFNYKEDKWEDEIAKLGGADVVLDMTGGDFVARNLACLNPGGRHVSIAFLRGADATINIMNIMRQRLKLSGSTMKARSFEDKGRLARDIRTKVWPHVESGAIKAAIDRVFPLAEASSAHKHMESGAHIGKIVLKTA